ncbi:PepSY-associated TM helix domain-containing protein [Nostoc sp. PA-18-2419]|uniref:PepSY-associated TM helix domain-containing protein n=1 Tax=Nostoc sp. PA-18-2419 TaxID=2575443 RepID=UPI0011087106|nr:PepSY-associated TM helix domain-containing protein [Nostoc sp. PA-18-2419]
MKSKKLRNFAFTLHRYIGLAVGLILVIVSLTGSVLVFADEIGHILFVQQFGTVVPQGQMLSPTSVVDTLKAASDWEPNTKFSRLYIPITPDAPYVLDVLHPPDNSVTEISLAQISSVFVNPYIGTIMGKQRWNEQLISSVVDLHCNLLAGNTGKTIVGIVCFLVLVLNITGLFLWSGWRKLISGFKIKWNVHLKRLYFDIHKLAGIITVVFLCFTAFTGVCWSFYEFSEPVIRAITLSPAKLEPVSQIIPNQLSLKLANQLKTSQAELPDGKLRAIDFPQKPDSLLIIRYSMPQEYTYNTGQSKVYLDQYSGKVLRVDNSQKESLGPRVLNSFPSLHYGTFGGLPTRIFYIFVGLAPLILLVTGFVMWWYRYKGKNRSPQTRELAG